MKSVMNHSFSQIPRVDIPRSVFNRSHAYKTTFNSGFLIPFLVDEAVPGDTFNVRATIFARLATPTVPFMDNLFLDTFYFAVPNRLLWNHWVNFQGEVVDPNAPAVDYIVPTLESTTVIEEGSIGDYFGLPLAPSAGDICPDSNASIRISALPFRAYNMIYNQWFRDENLISPIVENKGDGPDSYTQYILQRRGKRHDYFTSSLKWPQKGPGVQIPLGSTAPVYGDGKGLLLSDGAEFGYMFSSNAGLQVPAGFTRSGVASRGAAVGSGVFTAADKIMGAPMMNEAADSGLYADLSHATAATINSLRQAFQLQRLYERDARGGTRYTEMIRAHFGVTNPDFRMQRPEYLGGSSKMITVTPVSQMSATEAGVTPQGNLAAYGMVTDSNGGFHHSFTEHCTIIGLLNVRADLTYQQGINRMWARQYREDFYMPVLAHLGEQEVYNRELYVHGPDGHDWDVFGYQERYAEYRYFPSLITGRMRSNLRVPSDSLDFWHLSQNFGSRPTLGKVFIEENPPVSRVIAVESEPEFIMDSFIEMKCARPMPVYSVPGLIDHF